MSIKSARGRWVGGVALTGLLLAGAGFAGAAFVEQAVGEGQRPRHRMRGPGGPEGFLPLHLLRELNLSESQREQIRAARQAKADELKELRQKTFQARRSLHQATFGGEEEMVLRQLAEGLALAEGDLAVAEAGLHREVMSILTPEQVQKLEKLRAERDARLKERMERIRERRSQRRPNEQESKP
jgi:Spy/CpxP family protein refolding chaperone